MSTNGTWKLSGINELDSRAWLMFGLVALIATQQIAGTLTEFTEFRIGQKTALLLLGVLAYMHIDRNRGLISLARLIFYGAFGVLLVKVAAMMPGIFQAEPREWDFLVFFLDAKVAAAGLNMYDPESFIRVADEMQLLVTDEFRREIIGTGFKYPPITALLLYPLSFGGLEQSNRSWLLFVTFVAVLVCILLSRLFLTDSNRKSLLGNADAIVLASIIVLSIPFRGLGIRHGQTTGMICCFAILTMLFSGRGASGITACLSVVIKPFAAVPALIVLIGRYWSAVVAGLITAAIVVGASILLLGTDDWISYLRLEFATETPAEPYYEPGNLSLLAVLARAFAFTGIPWQNAQIMLWYSGLASLVAIPSVWMSYRISRLDFKTGYCLLLVMALIVYPGTLYTYTMIASVPLAVEYWNQFKTKEHFLVPMAYLGGAGLLLEWNLFAANLFIWAFLMRRGVIELRREAGSYKGNRTTVVSSASQATC